MPEPYASLEPFICIEVDENSCRNNLAKRFDELFPDRIIRLKINGEYTPHFYLGKSTWVEKQSTKNSKFECKICANETADDFLNDSQIVYLTSLGINTDELKVLHDVHLMGEEYPGIFFSNGNIHILDEFVFLDSIKFYNKISEYMDSYIMDSDYKEMIIFETNQNILGEK
jgi:hypothetical protein